MKVKKRNKKANNPLKQVGLVNTPNDLDELQNYLAKFNGSEAIVAQTCAFMAWNLASKIVDEHLSA